MGVGVGGVCGYVLLFVDVVLLIAQCISLVKREPKCEMSFCKLDYILRELLQERGPLMTQCSAV